MILIVTLNNKTHHLASSISVPHKSFRPGSGPGGGKSGDILFTQMTNDHDNDGNEDEDDHEHCEFTFPPALRPSPQLHERPEQAAAEEMMMILMMMTKILMLMMISNEMIIVMIIFKTCQ